MKYQRRRDINSVMRIEIAVQAFLGTGKYGEITRLAKSYNVCRLFIYQLLWEMRDLYEIEPRSINSKYEQKQIDREIIMLRMEGKCSLEAISEILKDRGVKTNSIGYISQRIKALAEVVPSQELSENKIEFYIADEIFAKGKPILVTADAKSLTILKIELCASRDGETWKKHWQAITLSEDRDKLIVVSDLGTGLIKGCKELGITHHPDLFHLLQPIAIFLSRFEQKAYSAISEEEKRLLVFDNGKTEQVLKEKLYLYEKAKVSCDLAIALYDNFSYLWQQLKLAFDLFDLDGNFTDPQENYSQVLAILSLLTSMAFEPLTLAVTSFRKAILSFWPYFYRAKSIYSNFSTLYPLELLTLISLAWQYSRKFRNSKSYSQQLYFKELTQHYLNWAESIYPTNFSLITHSIFEAYDSNIRSSSFVENINSSLRALLDNSRSQLSQHALNLFAFFHNHRPFLRGHRKGLAPIEILQGQPLCCSWVDSLLALAY
ncbi:MAG: hypothetical protein FD167_2988 [bacterium]|nr:MAG: hypothetical protein FD167_2988 [bacterium]